MRITPRSSLTGGLGFSRKSFTSLFRRGLRRRLACFALMMSLLIWPGSHLALEPIPAFASAAISVTTDATRYVSVFWKWLFGKSTARQQETTQTRTNRVVGISINPRKMVAYEGQRISFSAIGKDGLRDTVQGARFDWASSDLTKLQIDDSGEATLVSPGLVWVSASTAFASARVPVLIRRGHDLCNRTRNGRQIKINCNLTVQSVLRQAESGRCWIH